MQVSKRTLITGSADGTVRFWDIETAQPLHVIDLVRLRRSSCFVFGCNFKVEVVFRGLLELRWIDPHGFLCMPGAGRIAQSLTDGASTTPEQRALVL